MNILLVEDDYLQSQWLHRHLVGEFPGAQIRVIHTESQFHSELDELASDPPDVVVMDIMLRWADPAPDMPTPPAEVSENGFYRAGVRCARLLAQRERTSGVPLILYTVLEFRALEEELKSFPLNVIHLRKDSDVSPLIRLLRGSLQGAVSIPAGMRPEYDVALSFASEDRDFVERVAEHLKRSHIRLFYDRDEEVYLWGKDLGDTLDEVYRLRSKYVIIFISEHYARKMWTSHERKSAFARAVKEKEEYVLPARFDDTELPGLRPTISFIDLRRETPETFSSKIIRKVTRA
jgi:DNA-binding NarL/FixJ family response regulator